MLNKQVYETVILTNFEFTPAGRSRRNQRKHSSEALGLNQSSLATYRNKSLSKLPYYNLVHYNFPYFFVALL